MALKASLAKLRMDVLINIITRKLHAICKYFYLNKVYKFITSSRDSHLGHIWLALKHLLLLISGIFGFLVMLHAISFISPIFLQDIFKKPLHWYYNRVFIKYVKYIKRGIIQMKSAM